MTLERDVPSSVMMGGRPCWVRYAGQPKTCLHCGSEGHFAAACQATKCFRCQEMGHVARNCRNQPVCITCNQKGHYHRQCPISFANRVRPNNSAWQNGAAEVLEKMDERDQTDQAGEAGAPALVVTQIATGSGAGKAGEAGAPALPPTQISERRDEVMETSGVGKAGEAGAPALPPTQISERRDDATKTPGVGEVIEVGAPVLTPTQTFAEGGDGQVRHTFTEDLFGSDLSDVGGMETTVIPESDWSEACSGAGALTGQEGAFDYKACDKAIMRELRDDLKEKKIPERLKVWLRTLGGVRLPHPEYMKAVSEMPDFHSQEEIEVWIKEWARSHGFSGHEHEGVVGGKTGGLDPVGQSELGVVVPESAPMKGCVQGGGGKTSAKRGPDSVLTRRGRSKERRVKEGSARVGRTRSRSDEKARQAKEKVASSLIFTEDGVWFQCHCCEDRFAIFRRYLEHHQDAHSGEELWHYKCPQVGCGRTCGTPQEWANHLAEKHPDFVLRSATAFFDEYFLNKS